MSSRQRTLLMTGATGVVGSAVLAALAEHRVIVLAHRRPPAAPAEAVHGDVTLPRLGIDPAVYGGLADRIDGIVHCAGVVDFAAGYARMREVNVDGTGRVVELARHAGARLYHLSTAFVTREHLADVGAPPGETAVRPIDYVRTKREGEELIRASGVPHIIFRPSVVVGDSDTGAMPRPQGLHSFVRAVLNNRMPFVPAVPSSLLDIVPRDILAAFLAAAVAEDGGGAHPGRDFWATAGPSAFTISRLVDLIVRTGEQHGLDVPLPRIIDPATVVRLILPAFSELFSPADRRKFDGLRATSSLLFTEQAFPTSLGTTRGGPAALSPAAVERAMSASVTHLIRTAAERSAVHTPDRSVRPTQPRRDA